MSRTLPLSYVRPVSGSVPPGYFLTCAGGRSDQGQWTEGPSAELIDLTVTNTLDTLIAKHNELVWGYGLTRALTVSPRIYFGSAGDYGFMIYRDGVVINGGLAYAPYAAISAPYPSLSMSEFLTGLNTAMGDNPAAAEFIYDGTRILLLIKTNGWTFREPITTPYGSAKRMFNRIFNRSDADTTIVDSQGSPHTFTGPTLIQGQPLTGPIFGVFPVPAAVTNIRIENAIAGQSFDVVWNPSPEATEYYVRVQGGVFDQTITQTATTYTVSTSTPGIQTGVNYLVTVVASTPYEISAEQSINGDIT